MNAPLQIDTIRLALAECEVIQDSKRLSLTAEPTPMPPCIMIVSITTLNSGKGSVATLKPLSMGCLLFKKKLMMYGSSFPASLESQFAVAKTSSGPEKSRRFMSGNIIKLICLTLFMSTAFGVSQY